MVRYYFYIVQTACLCTFIHCHDLFTNHSSTPTFHWAHLITSLRTLSNAFSRSTKSRDLRSFEIRIRIGRSDSIRKWWADSKISNRPCARACLLLVVVKRIKPLTALSGTVYRLASSMSDHTPVLFNVSEEWNKKYVGLILYISFVSFVINYWSLNARFNSNSVGPSWNMLSLDHTLGDCFSRRKWWLYSRQKGDYGRRFRRNGVNLWPFSAIVVAVPGDYRPSRRKRRL